MRVQWEQVAQPDFTDVPLFAGSSMASVPSSDPSLKPHSFPHFSENSSLNCSFALFPAKESAPKQCNVKSQNSISASSHPSALSVKTRICPAKHGIAVSLCLVDSNTSKLVKVKDVEAEPKPMTWVSQNIGNSHFPGSDPDAVTIRSAVLDTYTATSTNIFKGADKNLVAGNIEQDKHKFTNLQDRLGVSTGQVATEGEYIDILQATMLFSNAQSVTEEQQKGHTQMQPCAKTELYGQMHRQVYGQISTHPERHSHSRLEAPASSVSNMSSNTGPLSVPQYSQPHHPQLDSLEPAQCVGSVWFSEKPCTPCMRRRQGGKTSKAYELRCRYRDSYQAAIQNPVIFGQQKERRNMLAAVEEDGDFSQCDGRQRQPGTETEDALCTVKGVWYDPGIHNQSSYSPTVSGAICQESGEENTVAYWKPLNSNTGPCMEHSDTNPSKYAGLQAEKNTVPFREQVYSDFGRAASRNTKNVSCSNDLQQSNMISAKLQGLQLQKRTSAPVSEYLPASHNRQETVSNGRCSTISTTVVDTSEKCAVVIVDGLKVRRRVNDVSCDEVPQLHVVKCKNSTAFRLVSPKINRRMVLSDGAQPGSASISSSDCHQMENLPQTASGKKMQICKPACAAPRLDHLPIGSPDPTAHPLYLGVASLTGGRDRTGRAIVELYGDHQGWRSAVTSQGLFQMLLYFHLITRREIREAGMTLIFDAKKKNPQPQLYQALMALKEQSPNALNSLVLLVNKGSSLRPEQCPGIKTDTVSSMKALLRLVEGNQLSSLLDGTLTHNHCNWMEMHLKLFPFVSDLHKASSLLLRAISKLEEPQRTDTVQTVKQCIEDQRTLMRDVLEDSRLVNLQRKGGAILARLRRENDLKYPNCEDVRDAVDSVTTAYNHMEEQAHLFVHQSNLTLQHLEFLKQLREIEEHVTQIQQWYNVDGEGHLWEAMSVEGSGERMEQILNSFNDFLIEAIDQRQRAMSLVSGAEQLQQRGGSYPETETFRTFVSTFKSGLEDFMCRAEACSRELQITVNVFDFCKEVEALTSECADYLAQSQTNTQLMQLQNQDLEVATSVLCQSECSTANGSGPVTTSVSLPGTDNSVLQTFQDRFLQFSPERFQEMKAQASALQGSKGMRAWKAAWLRFQNARQQVQERIKDVDKVYVRKPDPSSSCECVDVVNTNIQAPSGQSLVVQSTHGRLQPQWEGIMSREVDLGKRKQILGNNNINSKNVACCNIVIKPEDHSDAETTQGSNITPQSPNSSTRRREREVRKRQVSKSRRDRDASALSQSHTVGCQWFPWRQGLRVRSLSQESCTAGVETPGSSTPPEQRLRPTSSCSYHGQPSCQEAQMFQIYRHGSFFSEDSCMSNQGAAGANGTLCCKNSSPPIRRDEEVVFLENSQEGASNALRLQHVLEELVVTEREYVRSLSYILMHYLPLLDLPDIPQDLRGKRGVIFSNLEKIYNFHSHYFLPELEACHREPAMVARCFLRHSESFGMYSLYSKNKPQSDALLLHCCHDIFKKKQQELGDTMNLSSYLLRPIQRISKYNLLLQDMLSLAGTYRPKDMMQATLMASSVCAQSMCGPGVYMPDPTSSERDRERAEIQSAADLVRFQMRHGNDLLTMDAIQDCDVNLKEQGQLIRQDEFTVFFRKRKCVRRIFLFEDLILFSKTKKKEVGNDVYVYKQSFKTSDIGMTHNSTVNGLCFEIWFRRRKTEDTYTLRATSMEMKKAWTTDLDRILWDQANHSRELRRQERLYMGMGCKLFTDIQTTDAVICDRAVSCALPERIPVACYLHRGLDYSRPHSIGSGSTASTTLSQLSSSSGRGSLPPAGYPGNQSQGVETNPAICSSPQAVTNNELNSHHHHQHHRLHCNCEHWKSHHPLIVCQTSSEECINVFSISDRSCLPAISGETVDDGTSFVSHHSKPHPPLCQTPSLRRSSLPSNGIIITKSTEV